MFVFGSKRILIHHRLFTNNISTTAQRHVKVTIIGGSGSIGQSMALLLKTNPLITCVCLQDKEPNMSGIGLDLSHIDSRAQVEAHTCNMDQAVTGASIVVIAAGVPDSLHNSSSDVADYNGCICYNAARTLALHNPCAIIAVMTNPIVINVPIVSEVMKRHGAYDPRKIFGVTTLDLVRASKLVACWNETDPFTQYVPIVGGNDKETMIPLLSQCDPAIELTDEARTDLITQIRGAGDVLLNFKGSSATLSAAFAGARFVDSLARGLLGHPDIVEHSFVKCSYLSCPFFACPVQLGEGGAKDIQHYGKVDNFEQNQIEQIYPKLNQYNNDALKFVDCLCPCE